MRYQHSLVALLITTLICAPLSAAEKRLSKESARRALMHVGGLELKKSEVVVKEVSGVSAPVEVEAALKTAFHLRQRDDGSWQAVEVRVGDRQWEDVELLTRAWQIERATSLIAQVESLAAQLAARAQERAAEQKRRKAEQKAADHDESKKQRKQKTKKEANKPEDLHAGPLTVKNFSALLSSATIEAELDMTFRLERDAQGQWQATSARIGDGAWADINMLIAALNREKTARANAELEILARALNAFAAARGFYVVADTEAALVDQLNPTYLKTLIRIDPWHHPYEYNGTRNSYTLRSLGPDGKPNTADDVTKEKP